MKKLVAIVSICAIVYGCGNNGQKQQQATQAAAEQAKQSAIDSVTTAYEKQKTIDSLNTIVAQDSIAKAKESQTIVQPVATTTTAQIETRKKGWNSTTKGAVIGTGVGAVTGALVSKHKGTGAVVGGLLGAGAGAGTGAIIDNSKKKNHKQ